jgi:hypothetical protein
MLPHQNRGNEIQKRENCKRKIPAVKASEKGRGRKI